MTTAIDIFAGAGGSTTGANMAGINVIWAGNHNKLAIETHRQNYPDTQHAFQDLIQFDWAELSTKPDIVLASPSCQKHSRASGKKRQDQEHDSGRSTALALLDCIEQLEPSVFVVENVPDFRNWRLFRAWMIGLQDLGYSIDQYILNAADFGVPQNRLRYIAIGSRSKKPLEIKFEQLNEYEHTPIGKFIDWDSKKWKSIHDRKKPLVPNTLQRIQNGKKQFGHKPFYIAYYGQSNNGYSIKKPIYTIPTRDRFRLVWGDKTRMLNIQELKSAMSFPLDYTLLENLRENTAMLGNAVPPKMMQAICSKILEVA